MKSKVKAGEIAQKIADAIIEEATSKKIKKQSIRLLKNWRREL
jgi:hypothetical protein